MNHYQKPTGWKGRWILWRMNSQHDKVTDWGLAQIRVDKQATILDVGCGGGRTLGKLAAVAPQGKIYGIDFSETSVAESQRANARTVAAGRVEVRHASVTQLPFPDAMFDLVTAVETHFWWSNLESGLREIRRVLKPDGKLVLIAEIYKGAKTRISQWCEHHASQTGMKVLSPQEHRDLLIGVGYSDVELVLDEHKGWICVSGRREAGLQRYGT